MAVNIEHLRIAIGVTSRCTTIAESVVVRQSGRKETMSSLVLDGTLAMAFTVVSRVQCVRADVNPWQADNWSSVRAHKVPSLRHQDKFANKQTISWAV